MHQEQRSVARPTSRVRNHRALAAGAAVAVLGGALVGGSTLIGPDEQADAAAGAPPISVAAGGGQSQSPAQPVVSAAPASNPASQRPAPPWQEEAPPLPEGGMDPENPDWPNAWEIPDARPTAVDHLDDRGAPKQGMNYPRLVPVSGVMVCNTGAEDVEPEAGQSWMYYVDDSWESGSVDISVTGWADSTAARDALRDNTMTFCIRDAQWQQLEWPGHEADEDYLLYEADNLGLEYGFAIVRQGDYLVGVTVTDTTGDGNAEAAGEIAAKMADNLEALDADHGRD